MTDVSPDIADALGPMQSLFACEDDSELPGVVLFLCYTDDVVVKDIHGRYGGIVGIVIFECCPDLVSNFCLLANIHHPPPLQLRLSLRLVRVVAAGYY